MIVQYFPRNDRRLSFHVANQWCFLEQAIHRKCDSDQDVAFYEGVSLPPVKKKKSETQTGAIVSDEKRKRTFSPS